MALPSPDFATFLETFESVKDSSDLFAFLLFDQRASHEALNEFAVNSFDWLDSLATSSQMYLFLPISLDVPVTVNPSLRVADMFGINANQLPGLVLFTLAPDREGAERGVFFPLNAKLFEEDPDRVEALISDLFSVVQQCKRDNISSDDLLSAVTEELNGLQRREDLRPLRTWMTSFAKAVGQLPGHILKSIAGAFGAQLLK